MSLVFVFFLKIYLAENEGRYISFLPRFWRGEKEFSHPCTSGYQLAIISLWFLVLGGYVCVRAFLITGTLLCLFYPSCDTNLDGFVWL